MYFSLNCFKFIKFTIQFERIVKLKFFVISMFRVIREQFFASCKNIFVGIPLFDNNGELKYAVCFNTVSMEQINAIQQNYRHLQDSLQHYSQEIAELRTRATSTSL